MKKMHSLVLGMTESGKTAIAIKILKDIKRQGIKTITLDPLGDPNWHADFITRDPFEFEQVWKTSRKCWCFVDESGAVGKFSAEIRNAATHGRHWGHSFFFIAQKAEQIEPIVRDQCGGLFLFRSGNKSRSILAEEFDCPKLMEPLEMLEYHYVTRGGYVKKGKLTFKQRR